jgi:hypothetical protein
MLAKKQYFSGKVQRMANITFLALSAIKTETLSELFYYYIVVLCIIKDRISNFMADFIISKHLSVVNI